MGQTTTPEQFRKRAERMFRRANSDVAALADIEWLFTSRPHRTPFGERVRSGHFRATAPGYRTSLVFATCYLDTGEMSVR